MSATLDRDTIDEHYSGGYAAATADARDSATITPLSEEDLDDLAHTLAARGVDSAAVPFVLLGYLEGWVQYNERLDGTSPAEGLRALRDRMGRGIARIDSYKNVIRIDAAAFEIAAQAALDCHEWDTTS